MNIVLLGPPGAGKGTQGERLAARLHIPHISSGELFREIILKDSPLAARVRGYLDAGEYVPDDVATDVVLHRLREPDAEKGFLLDGFPRTVGQAETLDRALQQEGRQVDIALDIDAPAVVVTERLLARHAVEGRSDDVPEVILHRLKKYQEQTQPVVDYYARQHKLLTVNGSGNREQVDRAVDDALGIQDPAY